MTNLKRLVRFGLCCLLISIALLGVAKTRASSAASLTQGYHSAGSVALGAIVSTTKAGNGDIELSTPENEKLMVGVVVDSKDAIVDLQPRGSDVRVALNGEVTLLVSNLNGDIKGGDSLIISPIAGVAVKDTNDAAASKYIASANGSFTNDSLGAHQVSITLNDGSQKSVAVGTIRAKLLLTSRPSPSSKSSNVLSSLGSKIAGKPINTSRLLAATAVFMTTFSLTGLLLHGSVKGSFVSLGRNPLSKPMIINNLFKMVAFGFLIIIAGTALSYVILVV